MVKKICYLYSFLFLILLFMFTSVPVLANSPLKVQINGKEMDFDTQPVVVEGRMLVPVRKTAGALGLNVEWDERNQTVTIKGNKIRLDMTIGEKIAYKNGVPITLEVAPAIMNGRTMIPLRFLSEEYGYIIDWIQHKNTAVVFTSIEDERIYKSLHTEIPVLMYHILIDDLNTSLSVDPERFREQLLALKNAGYTTITEYDLIEYLEKGKLLPAKPILITFDDGYKSNYTEAYPILKELEMKATIYVITSRIFDDVTILEGESEKITWKDAKEMIGTMLIQSHTWNSHIFIKNESGVQRGMIASPANHDGQLESQAEYEARVYKDLVQSKKAIEEKMGYKVVSLAYPYGDYSADTIRLAQQAGYKIGLAVKDGMVTRADKPFELDRIQAYGNFSGAELINVIERAK